MQSFTRLRTYAPIVIVLALWLSACGSTPSPAANGNATPTVAATGSPTTALANGCPVQVIPVDPLPPAQVIVNQPSGAKGAPIMLNVGQSMEIHLSSSMVWHLVLTDPNQTLTAVGLSGWYNRTLSVCVWRYSAASAGNATFAFTGTLLCQQGQACPQLAIESDFDVTVK